MKLTAQQEIAYDQIGDWLNSSDQIFTLAGFAGTGKTTLINHITDALGKDTFYCAFTGKAALAMRDRGIEQATTIHSLIYEVVKPLDKLRKIDNLKMEITAGASGKKLENIKEAIAVLEREVESPEFILNMDSDAYGAELIVVDEYSMLTPKLVNDLVKFGKKILFVGDPGQLDPVDEDGEKCPLQPNYFLEEVVRQALDSPILRAATSVREHGYLRNIENTPEFAYSNRAATMEQMQAADQIICGKNQTRNGINRKFASKLDVGTKVVCLKNNHEKGIFNGMIAEATRVTNELDPTIDIQFRDKLIKDISIWGGYFRGEKPDYWKRENNDLFDYGYAITCHKSQGSEWDKVLIVADWRKGDKKWLYTAITRARKACRVYFGV